MSPSNYEVRVTSASDFEVRAMPTGFQFRGYAAVFNALSEDLGGFVEQIARGAFAKTIQEADVRALWNHDPNFVLGRNKAGTLRMWEDTHGLGYEVDAPDTQAARDLAVSMERGDVDQSSFGFSTVADDWNLTERDYPLRTLLEVRLFDVSPVTFPAYEAASSGVAIRSAAKHFGVDPTDITDLRALIKGEDPETRTESTQSDQSQDAPGDAHATDISAMRRLIEAKNLPADITQKLGR